LNLNRDTTSNKYNPTTRYKASQPGRLSLLPSIGWQSEYHLLGWIVVINGDGESSTTAASLGGSEAQADWLGPKVGGRPALVLHLSNEPSELSQWQCHDDSTIKIVVAITLTIITITYTTQQYNDK